MCVFCVCMWCVLSVIFMYAREVGCGVAEATGLGFACFVVINTRVLSARVDFGFFLFRKFSNFTPSPAEISAALPAAPSAPAPTSAAPPPPPPPPSGKIIMMG